MFKKPFKLDLKDYKILSELDVNARASNSEIAKYVGLSKDVINYRIKNLIEKDVIKGFYAVIDASRLGYYSFRIYIKLLDTPLEIEKEIISYLIEQPRTGFVNKIDGSYDIGIMVWVKNIYEFDVFWDEFKKRFRKYIGKTNTSIFTKVFHYKRAYLLNKEFDDSGTELIGGSIEITYDEDDLKILKLLASNARIPLIEIATKTKISIGTVVYRIKQLEKKNIIQGYRTLLNLKQLGYEYYKIDMNFYNINNYEAFLKFSQMHPNIIYVDKTIGGTDFEFDVEVKSKEEMFKIIEQIRQRFKDVRDYEYFSVRQCYKLIYMPII
jgi:DNA-binding Lrp family transcriptional regulator